MIKTLIISVLVLCASVLYGTNLKDVSYSIKQNGIMVNLDYSNPIKDDDIIGWKSDRGWVYLTLLGVRAPKNKVPQQKYRGSVKKIVIDDFDESTQLAILVSKPVLGYDIINSKASPSTVIFIHTEMRKSEVANLKKHIDEEGVSVFNVAKSSGFPKYNTNFKTAFDRARKELGPNSIFEYHGNLYTTNHPGEKGSEANSLLVNRKEKIDEDLTLVTPEPEKVKKEYYVDKNSGEILTESINDIVNLEKFVFGENKKNINEDSKPNYYQNSNKVDYENKKNDAIVKTKSNKKPQAYKKKQNFFSNFINRFSKRKTFISSEDTQNQSKELVSNKNPRKNIELQGKYVPSITQNLSTNDKDSISVDLTGTQESDINKVDPWFDGFYDEDFQKKNIELQGKYVPSITQNLSTNDKDSISVDLTGTQESDINKVDPWFDGSYDEDFQKKNIELQGKYIPSFAEDINLDTTQSLPYVESPTQMPDTNVIQAWFKDDSFIPDKYDPTRLQKQYIPRFTENINLDTTQSLPYVESPTQMPDTNVIQAWFKDDSFIPDEYDPTRLQKKYIPRFTDNINPENDQVVYPESPTQMPDTNVIQAWFKDDSFISDEYDVTNLQQKYVPSNKNNFIYNKKDSSNLLLSMPQKPEFTDPDVLDNRFKTRFKNNRFSNKAIKKEVERPFEEKKDQNTWLSFFPSQTDSAKESLNWEFKREKEVPNFLQTERESLNYSSNDNERYHWKDRVGIEEPEQLSLRQMDPGFMYYNNSGINVKANIDGIPIYIDGNYVGETPLSRPIEVEPGWHQVSGFSPVYTQLIARKGLQYVGYDPIIENNKLYGATTVYIESGKMETVELRFNQMGNTPKKWEEISGGMNIGIPMILLLFGFITWGIG